MGVTQHLSTNVLIDTGIRLVNTALSNSEIAIVLVQQTGLRGRSSETS